VGPEGPCPMSILGLLWGTSDGPELTAAAAIAAAAEAADKAAAEADEGATV
jgi:hypothetical protein